MKKRQRCLALSIFAFVFCGIAFAQESQEIQESITTQTATSVPADTISAASAPVYQMSQVIEIDTKSAAESFEKGKKYFKQNQPQLAIPYLENAILDENTDPAAYIFLGVSYYQTAQFEKAINIDEVGMKKKDSNTSILAYNGGNAAFSLGDFNRADVMFSLSLTADPLYPSAWLNRANTRMKQDRLDKAIDDYKQFLYLAPNDEQAPRVQILIGLLQEELNKRNSAISASLAEIEQLKEELKKLTSDKSYLESRIGGGSGAGNGSGGGGSGNGTGIGGGSGKGLSPEEAKALMNELMRVNAEKDAVEKEAALKEQAQAEAERLATQKAEEEEAKRQKILQDIMNSLQNSESTNMSAGVEGTFEYDYESELD